MGRLLARLGSAAAVGLLVLVGVLLAVLPSQGSERALSVFSTQPDGLRALFLLCEALGFPVEPWSHAPGDLAGRGTLLVLARLPEAPPDVPAALAPTAQGAAPLRRGRALTHYRRFVEEGGTLLVLAEDPGGEQLELAFLREGLSIPGLEDLAGLSLEEAEGCDRRTALVGAERLALARELRGGFLAGASASVLARAEDGSALALVHAVGPGRIALASVPPAWLDNGSLAEDGEPALLFTRVLERLAPFERVLFDEYALGGWRPEPAFALAFAPRLAWLSVHLLLVLLVLGWRSAWSGPFPRDPEPLLAASPLARARGFGRTLVRAGRVGLLARFLRRGVLERWDPRAGAARETEPSELEPRLSALARGDAQSLARLRVLFLAPGVKDERGLAALELELRTFEGELFAQQPAGKSGRGPGPRRSRTGS